MRPLTARQQQVLDFIRSYIGKSGLPPTIREIGAGIGVTSTRGIVRHLEALEKKGHLHRQRHSRGIYLSHPPETRTGLNLPILGTIAAGPPLLAEEDRVGSLILDPLFAHDENCFVLKVKGDSMIEAGILEGDYVVVRQQPSAENGEIVAALIENEATVKRFYQEGRLRIRLQPANPAMKPIYIYPKDAHSMILGKVIGVLRKVQ